MENFSLWQGTQATIITLRGEWASKWVYSATLSLLKEPLALKSHCFGLGNCSGHMLQDQPLPYSFAGQLTLVPEAKGCWGLQARQGDEGQWA